MDGFTFPAATAPAGSQRSAREVRAVDRFDSDDESESGTESAVSDLPPNAATSWTASYNDVPSTKDVMYGMWGMMPSLTSARSADLDAEVAEGRLTGPGLVEELYDSIGFTSMGWGGGDRSTSPDTDDFYDASSKPASAEMSSADTSPTESQRRRAAMPMKSRHDSSSPDTAGLSTSPDEIAYLQMGWGHPVKPPVPCADINDVRTRSDSEHASRQQTIEGILRDTQFHTSTQMAQLVPSRSFGESGGLETPRARRKPRVKSSAEKREAKEDKKKRMELERKLSQNFVKELHQDFARDFFRDDSDIGMDSEYVPPDFTPYVPYSREPALAPLELPPSETL